MKQAMFMGLICGVLTTGVYGGEDDGIFSLKVGKIEVYMLVEGQRDGNAGILVGIDETALRKYIPETGLKHSTNAFLVKTPSQIILIDTGTGSGGVILDKVIKLGVQPEKVDAILITHLHGDHFGTMQKDGKAIFPNAKVYLSAKEREYFTKTALNQGAVNALAAYGANVITFEPAELGMKLNEILPGISPAAAYGHTPGHTVYLIEDGNAKFIVAGDLLHVAPVQFPLPGISASYDTDKDTAGVTRKQVLEYAAKNNIPLGGMHIVYPGVGDVRAAGAGFTFTPLK
ncbi:MAG: MBL fold metallo-hydrolase [Treponema sp.]|jgi:glyoxylase-like metal-dependent hydrolase (beta-lactamase superfamily II)|nr:MBL fold metallo-hydrolase [Treponema sp.]